MMDTFIENLHFNIEKLYPENWMVDWDDAPLPFKLYQDLPEFQLSAEVPLSLMERKCRVQPNLKEIGHFLWYVYGITQYSQTAGYEGKQGNPPVLIPLLRRFVPSGGALYPNELYVYLKLEELPEGVYHYSAAHHRLVLLREGNFDSFLSRSLGNRCDISDCFGAVFITTVFWKNFYKYHNFSYRLQGLDTGVLIGQSLNMSEQMGFSAKVCFQFLDQAINHFLGISEQMESAYAVIPLSSHSTFKEGESNNSISANSLCRELPVLEYRSYQRSKKVIDYPLLRKINRASLYENTHSFVMLEEAQKCESSQSLEAIILPNSEPPSYDFSEVCQKRHSPETDFKLGKVRQIELSTLLKESLSSNYQNDLDNGMNKVESRLEVYSCLFQVDGIPNGAYRYDKCSHSLQKVSSGDFRRELQSALTIENVNFFQVPVCLHVVGGKTHYYKELGYRGYRIQQMEAGILVQKILLTAQALGLGGHPLLGFDAMSCDQLYKIDAKGKTCLIQIPVGPYRPRAWLKGSLHC